MGTRQVTETAPVQAGRITLRRFLLFYGAFTLLFLLLMTPMYSYIRGAVRQSEIDRCAARLESGIVSLNEGLDAAMNAAAVTAADWRFRSLLIAAPDREWGSIAQELKKMQKVFAGLFLSSSPVADAGLLIRDGLAFTRARLHFASRAGFQFYPEYIGCGELSYSQWRTLLAQSKGTLLPERVYNSLDRGTYNACIWAVNWPLGYISSDCLLYCTFPTESLIRLMADEDVLREGYIRLTDKEGRLLASRGEEGRRPAYEIQSESRIGGVTVTVGVPEHVLSIRLLPISRLIMIYLMAVILLALFAVLFFSWHSARPMRTLLTAFTAVRGPEEIASPPERGKKARLQKDYRFLEYNIQTMGNELKDTRRTVAAQQQILSAGIWERALNRGFYSEEEIDRFRTLCPDFPSRWRMAVIRYQTDIKPEALQVYAAQQVHLHAMISEGIPGAIVRETEQGVAVMLFPADSGFSPEKLEEKLADAPDGMTFPACAFSGEYSGTEDLCKAYRRALNLTFLQGDLPQIRQDTDVSDERFTLPLGIADTETLYSALRSADLQMAERIRSECLRELEKDPDNVVVWSYSFQQITQTIARLYLEFPGKLALTVIPVYNHARRQELFGEELSACITAICASMSHSADVYEQRREKVLRYIEDHLDDSSLDITSLSDAFGISATTLQKITRMATGMSVASYIEKRRMDQVKTLLSETDLSVREIAARCGFNSVNSFYKVFRRHSSLTPNELRQISAKKSEKDTGN